MVRQPFGGRVDGGREGGSSSAPWRPTAGSSARLGRAADLPRPGRCRGPRRRVPFGSTRISPRRDGLWWAS